MRIYLASSCRNTDVPLAGRLLRAAGHVVYDQWWSPVEFAKWEAQIQGVPPGEAINFPQAEQHYFSNRAAMIDCDTCVLLLPAGNSAHLELGFFLGGGKRGYVVGYMDRSDIMYRLATGIFATLHDFVSYASGDIRI